MLGNFYSDNTGYNAKQLNIQSGTMGESVAFESFKFGTHIVYQTADTVSIDTGITVDGFIVQVYRAGTLVNGYSVSASNTTITVATNGTDHVLTSGDIINWFAFA
jgi:hypothetical protein